MKQCATHLSLEIYIRATYVPEDHLQVGLLENLIRLLCSKEILGRHGLGFYLSFLDGLKQEFIENDP